MALNEINGGFWEFINSGLSSFVIVINADRNIIRIEYESKSLLSFKLNKLVINI